MDTTKTLLDRLAAHWGNATNYGLAKRLGISKSAVIRYQRHGGSMSSDIGLRVAAELKLDPDYVLLCLLAEREPSPEVKTRWQHLVARLERKTAPRPSRERRRSKVAAVALALGITGFSATVPPQAQAEPAREVCILRKIARGHENRRIRTRFTRHTRRRRGRTIPTPAPITITC